MSETLTLNQVYDDDGLPMPDELLWEWVGTGELDTPFPVVTVNPVEYVKRQVPGLSMTYRQAFKTATREQKAHVKNLRKLARMLATTTVMVLFGDQIIDGWHRMLAFALEGITQAKAVELTEEDADA